MPVCRSHSCLLCEEQYYFTRLTILQNSPFSHESQVIRSKLNSGSTRLEFRLFWSWFGTLIFHLEGRPFLADASGENL